VRTAILVLLTIAVLRSHRRNNATPTVLKEFEAVLKELAVYEYK